MSTRAFAPATTEELNRLVRAAGMAALAAYIALIPFSLGIAAVSPFGVHQEREAAAFRALVNAGWLPWPAVAAFLTRVVSGDSALAVVWVRTTVYVALLSTATVAALVATACLGLVRHLVARSTVTLVLRVAVALGVANALIYPMFTQDMWMSVVWGRMLLDGHNPYYEFFTPAALAGTPLLDFPIRMTYGPLWAWMSAGVAAASGSNGVWAFAVSKLLLLGCWLGALWTIRAMLADRPPPQQAGALCFFGWWPVSVHFAVGEGHNDVAMVCLVLLWALLAQRKWQWLAVLALTASVLIKYVSAPLLFVELWRGWTTNKRSKWAYGVAVACSALAGLVVTAPLWRDPRFLDPVLEMQGWEQFLTPAQAVATFLYRLGIPLGLFGSTMIGRAVFGATALYYGLRYARKPGSESLFQIVFAIMSAVLFAGAGHIWPWFLIWILAPAALVGAGPLWRLALAAAVTGPFLNILWLSEGWMSLPLAGVVFFMTVGLIAVCPLGWSRFEWRSDADA